MRPAAVRVAGELSVHVSHVDAALEIDAAAVSCARHAVGSEVTRSVVKVAAAPESKATFISNHAVTGSLHVVRALPRPWTGFVRKHAERM